MRHDAFLYEDASTAAALLLYTSFLLEYLEFVYLLLLLLIWYSKTRKLYFA